MCASLTQDLCPPTLGFDLSLSLSMFSRFALPFVLTISLGTMAGGCEKVDHDNIDKWGHTEKGPKKLLKALKNDENSADLRAHAAQVLVELGRFSDIKEVLEGMEDEPRHKVMAELSTRLWELARINSEMAVPTPGQSTAKDVLYYTIDLGDSATTAKIAGYLVEWYTGGHYEGRATVGRVSGAMAIRKVGEASATRLLNSARAIIAKPPDASGKRYEVGEELLKALALSGSSDALEFLMDLVDQPRGDKTLPRRAIGAMHFAFVEPLGMEPVDGKAVNVIAKRLEAMFYKDGLSPTMRNDAVAVLAAMDAKECIPIFTRMIRYPSDQARYRWMGTQHGIRCGGEQGIEAITEALPATVDFERGMLSKYLWDEILKLDDKKKIATAAQAMLASKSWVSRVSGAELLGALGKSGDVPENIKLIGALRSDAHRLKNWWGKQEKVPKSEHKPTPTLGQVAADVAKSLETLALGAEGK